MYYIRIEGGFYAKPETKNLTLKMKVERLMMPERFDHIIVTYDHIWTSFDQYF